MKVLFLSTDRGPGQADSAYTHRLENLRGLIQQHGIQTEILRLRQQPIPRPILLHPLNLPFIRQKISDYDFIHAGADAAYTAAFLKPYTRAWIIHDVHGDTLSECQLNWTARRSLLSAYFVMQARILNAVAYRHADYFLAVSKPLQQQLVDEKHVPAHKIDLVRNGVDLSLFNPSPHHPTKEFIVCYAGGFQYWQGIDNLVTAGELLPRNRVRLKIIGFTERDSALKSTIAGRLGDTAELVDRVTLTELVPHLAAAHVLVIPRSRHRATEVALPTKFAEYLALGRPIIVSDVDETASLVREHHCGLVSDPNPTALMETIRKASNLSQVELNQMGQNARRLAEREFSWNDIGRKYADLLTGWLDRAE